VLRGKWILKNIAGHSAARSSAERARASDDKTQAKVSTLREGSPRIASV